jgi:hypothetical protein
MRLIGKSWSCLIQFTTTLTTRGACDEDLR